MPADVRRRWDGHSVTEVARPSNKANGLTYDADLEPPRLRARHLLARPLPRRPPRGAGRALRGPRAQQPERRRRPLRRLDLVHRPLVRPHAGLRRRAPAPPRLAGRLPPPARRRRARARRRPATSSPSRTASASRPTKAASTSTTPSRRNIRVFDVTRRRHASPAAASSPRACKDSLRPGVPDGMKCDEHGNVWVTAPGGLWVYDPDGAAPRQGRDPRARRQPRLGRRRLAHALRLRHDLGLRDPGQGRPAPASPTCARRARRR